MRRFAHYLKGNKTSQLPHAAIWFDTETHQTSIASNQVSHSLWFGYACFQRTRTAQNWTEAEWCRFTAVESFWQWVDLKTRDKTRVYMFAHNLSFDGPVLHAFTFLPVLGWKLIRTVIESPPVILVWKRDKRTLIMLDTLNWWRMPLQKVGESVGFPKLLMPEKDDSENNWDTYCKADVEVIRRAVHAWWRFLRQYDLGGFAPTLASQSFRSFRHRFMNHSILVDVDPDALRLARTALHGGRTEAFFIGRYLNSVHVYDVNSMYPFVMKNFPYPAVWKAYYRRATTEELERWVKEYCLVAKCFIETDEALYAHRLGSKLVFPVGRFVGYLTTPDIETALSKGHICETEEVALYERAPIFVSFINELYRLRLEAKDRKDIVSVWLLKILMNSLYGKFGQKGNVWETVSRTEDNSIESWYEHDVDTGKTYRMRRFSGILQEKKDTVESLESHPAIAAHVTAYARRRLWNLIEKAGKDNVLYSDTDSLYVTDEGKRRLTDCIDETTLGGLKHEGTFPWIEIFGPKDYRVEGKRVCKGVKPKARWTSETTAIQDEWTTLRGLIRRGDMDKPITTTKGKTLQRVYDKGVVQPDGRVEPLTLREW